MIPPKPGPVLFFFSALFSSASLAIAVPVPVPDASFEDREVPGNSETHDLSPWVCSGGPEGAFIGNITSFSADGFNHLGVEQDGLVTNSLPTRFEPDTAYTLTVAIGNLQGSTQENNASFYELADDHQGLINGTVDASALAAPGSFADATSITFNTAHIPSAVGQNIRVQLAAFGSGRSFFDHVRLEKTSIVVTNDRDSGPGSLSQAIADAPSGWTILFDPLVFDARENPIGLRRPLAITGKDLIIDASNISGGITLRDDDTRTPLFGGYLVVEDGAKVLLRSLCFRGGSAGSGGAIAVMGGETDLTAENCLFDSNIATGNGGAIYNEGRLSLSNCTLFGNEAPNGSAILVELDSTSELRHCTIVGNAGRAALEIASPATVLLLSCIVSGNSTLDLEAPRGATFTSLGGNTIGLGSSVTRADRDQSGITNPLLAPLALNGGTTPTMLPLPGSRVFDHGLTDPSSPAFDARGMARTRDRFPDSGAVESDWSFNVGTGIDPDFGLASDITVRGDPVSALPVPDSPVNEGVANAVDNISFTKYLNFSIDNCGLLVVPRRGPSRLAGFSVTSADDYPERDPATFVVIGHTVGRADTVIASGLMPAFTARNQIRRVWFDTPTGIFAEYSIFFPSIVGPRGGYVNSMQIAEVELLGATENTRLRLTRWEHVGDRQSDGSGIFQADFVTVPGSNYRGVFSPNLDFGGETTTLVERRAYDWQTTFEFFLPPGKGFIRIED